MVSGGAKRTSCGGQSPSGARSHRWPLAALCLLLLTLPAASASVPYSGPGHEGVVPLGDGGLSMALPPDVGDDRTFVALTGLPSGTCRIVLDENGTYAATHVAWQPGDPAPRVYADAGAADAPYRVVAHWLTDINGACTAEVTERGTIWHDPRGRPYRDPVTNTSMLLLSGQVGTTLRIAVTVANNGTLPTSVTAALSLQQEGWSVSGGSPVIDVEVAPLEAQGFHFDVDIPRSQKPVHNAVVLALSDDHGWSQKVTAIIALRPADPEPSVPDAAPEADDEPLPEWRPPAQEAPVPALAPLALLAFLLVVRARARR